MHGMQRRGLYGGLVAALSRCRVMCTYVLKLFINISNTRPGLLNGTRFAVVFGGLVITKTSDYGYIYSRVVIAS